MEHKMKNHLSDINEEKIRTIREIRELSDKGLISAEEAAERLREKIKSITPAEIAYAEQTGNGTDNDDECIRENMQQMRAIFKDLLQAERPSLPAGHPIDSYYKENDAVCTLVAQMKELYGAAFIKNRWLELYEQLEQFKTHLSRKQNQLYSALERKGFDKPSTTMWTYDNLVRDTITGQHDNLKRNAVEAFLNNQPEMERILLDLIDKENTILLPTALEMLSESEFASLSKGDFEIGFCLIPTPPPYIDANEATSSPEHPGLAEDLAALLGKYGIGKTDTDVLDVAEGKLTLEQINLIFKHLPVDLSFVDENEIVRFYSDTEHRVFPRSKGVIGREVRNCHPPKSVHVVEEIIEKFRTGEQSRAEFWINKPGLFIYIIYVAVRDAGNNFRGVLEMMQNCTHIREKEGSRTLLTWEEEGKETSKAGKETAIHSTDDTEIALTPDTKLTDLFRQYPLLKKELVNINERFGFLQSPLAKVILPKATLGLASKYGEIPYDTLVDKIKELIKRY
ncbi:DUF438 domain-containing protein [Porphyromonas macacae]|uniref:DUF438 domain-containing protein n=1 Tax=Porphyromonas macacae TaxID=28115 RepID=UPI0024ACC68C|nr:PAS domain-containing protein [Porphyromonas macacae]